MKGLKLNRANLNVIDSHRHKKVLGEVLSQGAIAPDDFQRLKSIEAHQNRISKSFNVSNLDNNKQLFEKISSLPRKSIPDDDDGDQSEELLVMNNDSIVKAVPKQTSKVAAKKAKFDSFSSHKAVSNENDSNETTTTSGERIQSLLQAQKVTLRHI